MTALIAFVVALVTALPSGARFERYSVEDKTAFASGVASAVAAATCTEDWAELEDCKPYWPASGRKELAALLVTIAWFESGLEPRIGAGKCRANECDAVKLPGGRILHQANGYWQLHKTGLLTADEWREVRGTGEWSVFVQATGAARTLAASVSACRGSGASRFGAAISGFATGGTTLRKRCWWSKAPIRERVVRLILAKATAQDKPRDVSLYWPSSADRGILVVDGFGVDSGAQRPGRVWLSAVTGRDWAYRSSWAWRVHAANANGQRAQRSAAPLHTGSFAGAADHQRARAGCSARAGSTGTARSAA